MREHIRAELARLPTGQRRFVIIGTLLLLLYGGAIQIPGAVGVVRTLTRSQAAVLIVAPAYPGARAESRADTDTPAAATHTYQARTTDQEMVVARWYDAQLRAGGWTPGARAATYTRASCPRGFASVRIYPDGDASITVRVEIITNGAIRSLLPGCS